MWLLYSASIFRIFVPLYRHNFFIHGRSVVLSIPTGNLIRTLDGKLAILDFGLMTQITDNQKFGMIEAISHLVHRDYEGIGDDFKRLDFIPEEVPHSPWVV